jgi:hypothetical protein
MPEKDFEELQAACAALIGCLDRAAAAGFQKRFAERLSHEVSGFYATISREVDAMADTLRAEDFDHFPPTKRSEE